MVPNHQPVLFGKNPTNLLATTHLELPPWCLGATGDGLASPEWLEIRGMERARTKGIHHGRKNWIWIWFKGKHRNKIMVFTAKSICYMFPVTLGTGGQILNGVYIDWLWVKID
jgi:hypothetical protein